MRVLILLVISLYLCDIATASTYYVSPTGSDNNPGTINSPFRNLQKLNSVMVAGDIAYIRGGTYQSTFGSGSAYHLHYLNLNGTAASPIIIENYPGEDVIMDFASIGYPTVCQVFAVYIENCSFLTLKGITFRNLKQVQDGCNISYGVHLIESNHCKIENLDIYNFMGTGLSLNNSSDNLILNVDSHHNGDALSDGGADAWDNADGFGINSGPAYPANTSTRDTFRYCRAWLNSDDGWDVLGTNGIVVWEGCWSSGNGIKPWGLTNNEPNMATMTPYDPSIWFLNSAYWSGGLTSASGEGFKLGDAREASSEIIHFVNNCIGFYNRGTGFASNSIGARTGIHQLWNCAAYNNANDGFGFGAGWCSGTDQRFKNNWSWNNNQSASGGDWVYDGNNSSAISNNLWSSVYQGVNYGNLYPNIQASAADFLSVAPIPTMAARQTDGSLPNITFLKLSATSDLINKGVNVGLPFCGTAPDLGAFEYCAGSSSTIANAGVDQTVSLPQNSITLTGTVTTSGTITAWQWTKISGGNALINTPSTQTSIVTGLVQGIYLYELKVTDNNGNSDTDSIQVTVNSAVNLLPVAGAGNDQVITLPTSTTSLNGSGTDPDGTITAYLWTRISGPASGTIANAASATTSATGLAQGVYKFQLKVTDNSGTTDTDTMQVTVNAANTAPTANAGLDQNITLPTNTASLNGSGTDPDGTITAYLWTKISGPANGTIANAASATTSASGLVQGVYKFQLKITDNSGATDTDTMQVTVNAALNQLPTANAGLDQNITLPTNTASLNGSGTDPDGTITAYIWTKISGPANGTISNAASATTSATGLVQGVYKFQLKVTDNSGATDTDTMQVTVNAAINQLPTANAGLDQNITLPTNNVSLNGSGTDPDGTITAYLWTKISGPASGTISNAVSATTSLTGLVQGVYKFQLKVTDNSGATDTDTMQVTVNAANTAPTANAGLDQNITLPTNNVSLNGIGTDPDGTITAYRWRKISGPVIFTITNTTTAATTVTGLVQGVYQFELRVTDNNGANGFDSIQVTVNPAVNQLPTANAGLDKNITLPTNTASLNGSGTDPDGTITSYLWTKISGPSTGTIANAASATTSATGLVQGVYKFQLKVTDNSGATDTDTMQVTVNAAPNQVPVAEAGLNQSITLPTNTVTLLGSGTDPDGTITAYLWTKISGPSNGTITNATSASTTVTGMAQGIYQFQLQVTDNSGAIDTDVMQVNVNAAPPPPNQAPIANAGSDQNITLPTNTISLNGIGTDPDGTITSYRWRKISGPTSFTINNTTTEATTVTVLVQGIYQFEFRVTDNNGANGFDTMQVTVNPAVNQLPTANAGMDQLITLPTNVVSLNGSATDPDGTITTFLWTKISGPSNGTITNATSASTTVTGMVQGVYQFQLQVTDNNGAIDTDVMQVNVNEAPPAPNMAPAANAGTDTDIYLPDNSLTLSGSGTDPDGQIVSYNWSIISNAAFILTNSNSAISTLSNLQQGIYEAVLTVTDNRGAIDRDTIKITVGASRLRSVIDDVIILGNPVQNTLTAEISSSSKDRLLKILLYSINGAVLYEKSMRMSQNVQLEKIDMTKFSKGTYILQVYFDKITPVTKKAIKL